jgi:hypothetical protein
VIKPYQTVLNVDVRLVPQPATLTLLSHAAGAELLLNGSEYYLRGGKDGKFEKLAPLDTGNQQIQLSPGDYRLTIRRPPAQEKSVSFHLGPRGAVSVSVGFDPQQGSLNVEMTR